MSQGETLDDLMNQAANLRRQISYQRALKKLNEAIETVESFGYTVHAEVRPVENNQKEKESL